jgi:hypothetical protein
MLTTFDLLGWFSITYSKYMSRISRISASLLFKTEPVLDLDFGATATILSLPLDELRWELDSFLTETYRFVLLKVYFLY